jgi:ribosomal protein L20A (L18A)
MTLTRELSILKVYQITFTFLDPSKAVAEIIANNEEDAKEKLLEEMNTYAAQIKDIEIISIEEVINDSSFEEEDISTDRVLN